MSISRPKNPLKQNLWLSTVNISLLILIQPCILGLLMRYCVVCTRFTRTWKASVHFKVLVISGRRVGETHCMKKSWTQHNIIRQGAARTNQIHESTHFLVDFFVTWTLHVYALPGGCCDKQLYVKTFLVKINCCASLCLLISLQTHVSVTQKINFQWSVSPNLQPYHLANIR